MVMVCTALQLCCGNMQCAPGRGVVSCNWQLWVNSSHSGNMFRLGHFGSMTVLPPPSNHILANIKQGCTAALAPCIRSTVSALLSLITRTNLDPYTPTPCSLGVLQYRPALAEAPAPVVPCLPT